MTIFSEAEPIFRASETSFSITEKIVGAVPTMFVELHNPSFKAGPMPCHIRVAAMEQWRDEHISSVQPHTVCILEDRRKGDEHEWLERIERKSDRLEERIDKLTEKIH